jgi:hypothetical protein
MKRQRYLLIALGVALTVMTAWGVKNAQAILQPIPAPPLKPFSDNRDWMLIEDIIYQVGNSSIEIIVPKGFVTDFASIPQALWSFGLSPNGLYSKAAIIHDYLYWTQLCTRLQADNILMIAMKESQVPADRRDLIYAGVRGGGSAAWKDNAAQRANGFPKVISVADMNFGPLVLWKDYQQTLRAQGVKDPVPRSATYCSVGNSTDVPQH